MTKAFPADEVTELEERPLFDLEKQATGSFGRGVLRLFEQPLEKLLSLDQINRMYARLSPVAGDRTFFATALRGLEVSYDLEPEDVVRIPPAGPLVVVANHPFGGVDGLILGDILTRIRPDFRLVANHLLSAIPELLPWILPVEVLGGDEAQARNISNLRQSIRWLDGGGALGIFPAGTVSHLQVRDACVADPAWHTMAARLARRTGATVLAVFFSGQNSLVFQLSGLIHPRLRTMLLPSEMLKRVRSRVDVRIGRPIEPHKLSRYPDDGALTSYLRFKTTMLKWRGSPIQPRFSPPPVPTAAQPIVQPQSPARLAAEVARLPPQTLLAAQGRYQVYLSDAYAMPALLVELGRLREATFRAAGEGTGQACDVDRFDRHYQHLFLWNSAEREVVGSYRIGMVDRILATKGMGGLYSNTLFKMKPSLLERLGPALELGRSFVRQEYQGQAVPLALIWRGIGEHLARNPIYKVLFGPVSISKDYAALSQRLMVEFLGRRHGHEALGSLVKPRNPLRGRLGRQERETLRALIHDADDISMLVADIEEDNKGLPVLLRHYLRLNAFLLSFNLDPGFGNCIDGLIVVDLRTSEPKLLRRYMGETGYESYMRVPGMTPVLSLKERS